MQTLPSYKGVLITDILHRDQAQLWWLRDLLTEYIFPEEIIRLITNKDLWYTISTYQVLSEDFIIEMAKYVDWNQVILHQQLSKDFVLANLSHFNLSLVKMRYARLWKQHHLDTYLALRE